MKIFLIGLSTLTTLSANASSTNSGCFVETHLEVEINDKKGELRSEIEKRAKEILVQKGYHFTYNQETDLKLSFKFDKYPAMSQLRPARYPEFIEMTKDIVAHAWETITMAYGRENRVFIVNSSLSKIGATHHRVEQVYHDYERQFESTLNEEGSEIRTISDLELGMNEMPNCNELLQELENKI